MRSSSHSSTNRTSRRTRRCRHRSNSMNHYGHLAERYWTDWRPSRVIAMDDPATFFTEMGQQVQHEVDMTYAAMTKVVPADVPPEKVEGWKNMARKMAEEKALAEIVYLEPDLASDEDDPPEEP